jgi:tellurite resistance protein TerB
MSMSWLQNFADQAKTKLAQFNNATFKNAAMATCALVAAADGSIDPEEKKKVAALIQKNEMLQAFNAGELRDLFLSYCDKATDDFDRIDLFSEVRKLKSNPEQAEYAVKVALIIANADGVFDDDEKATVTEICKTLGLPASEYVS